MNKGIEKFKKRWFAPRNETTIMNWDGIIKSSGSIFGNYHSAAENEYLLKLDIWNLMIEPELIQIYKLNSKKRIRGKKR